MRFLSLLAAALIALGMPSLAASAPKKKAQAPKKVTKKKPAPPKKRAQPSKAAKKKEPAPPKQRPAASKKKPAAKKPPPPPPPPPKPPRHIPHPIEIAQIDVEIAAERALITSELHLSRGRWKDEDLRVHVAYGAPGAPLAFEAWLCKTPSDEACVALSRETSYRAPSDAAFVIGPQIMAGETIEIPAAALSDAFDGSDKAIVKLRQLRPLPEAGASGDRELLIRLGQARKRPYPLGSIDIRGQEGISIHQAEARLCGVDVEERTFPLSPELASISSMPRKGHEDLCIRFVSSHLPSLPPLTEAPKEPAR